MATRGSHLLNADRSFVTGAGLLGRLAAPAFARILDQLHDRLREGGIHGTLPDGSTRRIGFHAPGPEPVVTSHSWLALVRLATSGSVGWYKAWARGEWSSPDPVPLFDLFMRNAVSLAGTARAKGPFRLVNWLAHQWRDNAPGQARRNIEAHYDLGNDFYAAWLDPSMSYSSAVFTSPLPPAGGAGGGSVGAFDLDKPSPNPSRRREGDFESAQHAKISAILDRLAITPAPACSKSAAAGAASPSHAAKRGARVTGLTLSTEQKAWAEQRIAEEGLADRITIRLEDYRDHRGTYDASPRSRWSKPSASAGGPPISTPSPARFVPAAAPRCNISRSAPNCSTPMPPAPTSSRPTSSPAACCSHEPRFRALAADRGLSWHEPHAFGLDYAETLSLWRINYDAAVAGRSPRRLQSRIPRLVALLSDVLRRRIPRRRYRRRPGNA